MVNYIDEDKFFQWYEKMAANPDGNHSRVLNKLYSKYCDTGMTVFTLAASETKSGQAESFPFRFEDVGCCGASTLFIYF